MVWELINKSRRNKSDIVIEVCHSEPGAWKPASYSTTDCPIFSKRRSYHIGRTMFETDRIPKGWAAKMNKMDEVWVPSEFMKSIFEKGGVHNVHVVGESVDTAFFRPIPSVRSDANCALEDDMSNSLRVSRDRVIKEVFEPHPRFGSQVDIFLSIFKWEMRKGWDILLDAYLHSFTNRDPVSLFIISQEYHTSSSLSPSA